MVIFRWRKYRRVDVITPPSSCSIEYTYTDDLPTKWYDSMFMECHDNQYVLVNSGDTITDESGSYVYIFDVIHKSSSGCCTFCISKQ